MIITEEYYVHMKLSQKLSKTIYKYNKKQKQIFLGQYVIIVFFVKVIT